MTGTLHRGSLAAVAAAIGVFVACSGPDEPFCPNGVWPFDGQTGVPRDVVIVVRTGSPLPEDAPPLDDAVALTTATDAPVPFHTEVDGPAGEIHVFPDRPLEPDTEYRLGVVDWFALGSYPHWWGDDDFGRDYTLTTFTTRSRPELLAVFPSDEDATIILAFSEPMDHESLEGELLGRKSGIYEDLPMTVIGAVEGEEHLLWVEPAGDPIELDSLVLRGGRSAAGAPLASDASFFFEELGFDPSNPLERFSGLPYCLDF